MMDIDCEQLLPPPDPPKNYSYTALGRVAMNLCRQFCDEKHAGVPLALPLLTIFYQHLLEGRAQERRFLSFQSCVRQAIKQIVFPALWSVRSARMRTLQGIPREGLLIRIEVAEMQKQWDLISGVLPHMRDLPIWLLCGERQVPPHCLSAGFPALPNAFLLKGTMAEFMSAYAPRLFRWNQLIRRELSKSGLPPRASFRFAAIVTEILMYGVQMRALLRETRPKMIVVDCDHHPISTWLVFLAKEMGIPTITLQHGALADPLFFFPLWAGHALLWGKEHEQMYSDFGASKERIRIVGCPRMDRDVPSPEEAARTKAALRIPPSDSVVLLTTDRGSHEDRTRLARTAWEAVRPCPSHTLLIKCHPAEDPAFYRKLFRETDRIRIASDKEILLPLAFAIADVVLAQWSMATCDAMLKGKPVILIDNGQGFFSNQGILDQGACLVARNREELTALLINRSYSRQKNALLHERADEYISDFSSAYGAESARLTAGTLRDLWRQACPPKPSLEPVP